MSHAKSLIAQMEPDSTEALVAEGCILYKEEKFEDAKAKFSEALNITATNVISPTTSLSATTSSSNWLHL